MLNDVNEIDYDLYGNSRTEIENNLEMINKKRFRSTIESMMMEYNINIMEALEEYSDQHKVDVDDILPFLDNDLKMKIKDYALSHNLLKNSRKNNLPV